MTGSVAKFHWVPAPEAVVHQLLNVYPALVGEVGWVAVFPWRTGCIGGVGAPPWALNVTLRVWRTQCAVILRGAVMADAGLNTVPAGVRHSTKL